MRLVEQPQLGAAGDEAGERGAPALPGRQLADEHVAQTPVDAEPLHRRRHLVVGGADGGAPEPDVLGHGEVAVEPVAMPEQADPRPHRVALGGEVEPEHARPCRG